MRCHISLTGLPIALEIAAASKAASANRWRPNEPPPSVTCTFTLPTGSPSSEASCSWAQIGVFRHDQISALVGADVGDRAVGLQRVAGPEVEREALVERLRERQRRRHRQLGLLQVG